MPRSGWDKARQQAERVRANGPVLVPGNVSRCLEELGIHIERVTGDEAIAHCPGHFRLVGKPDRDPSWSVNLESGMHNCLAGETRVITRDGTREIRDLAGTDVQLLTSKGWQIAPVKSFGVQKLLKITLTRNGIEKVIRATPEHRWFTRVATGTKSYYAERTTADLRPGHRLQSVAPPRGVVEPSQWGVAHGFTFGDGTRLPTSGCKVAVFGAKQALLEYFPAHDWDTVVTDAGVEARVVTGLPRAFKDLPDLSEHAAYLYGWLAGYFAADGCVTSSGALLLNSAKYEDLEFVRNVATRLGLVTHPIIHQDRKGYGDEVSRIYRIAFSRRALTEGFFLLPVHRERWLAGRDGKERLGWTVVSVEETGDQEEVFCAQVPATHDFALEDNILTGNCFSCGFRGPFVAIVREVLGLPSNEADAWVRSRGSLERVERMLTGEYIGDLAKQQPKAVTEADLALYIPPPSGVLDTRNIDPAAAAAFGILYDPLRDCWITPIRDPDTRKLWGWQEKSVEDRYFRNRPRHMEKSLTLFGLDQPAIGRRAIMVESPLDASVIRSAGIPGALSSFGAAVSDAQMQIVLERFDILILALDNDPDGQRNSERIYDHWHRRLPIWQMPYLVKVKDPGEMEYDEIHKCIRAARLPGMMRAHR